MCFVRGERGSVDYFFMYGEIPNGCNSNFIALIPKILDANMVKDFRPITFVADRQILDGPFILDEVLQWCRRKKKHALIFKVDFEKAFDSVRWDFVDDVLNKFGFGERWRTWIQSCLRSSRGSILVNGSPTEEFQFFRGLKQGTKVRGNMSRKQAWKEVVDKVLSRLSRAKMKLLSIGGRITLLKSHDQRGLGFFSQNVPYGLCDLRLFMGEEGNLTGCLWMDLQWRSNCWTSIVHEVRVLQGRGINVADYIQFKAGEWGEHAITISKKKLKEVELRDGILYSLAEFLGIATLVPCEDRYVWTLESDGVFSVASIRKEIDGNRFQDVSLPTRWVKSVPIKVNIIAWKVKSNALPTRFNISRRGMDIDSIVCPICNAGVESTNHIFFQCVVVRQIMRKISSWWNIDYSDVNSYEEWQVWLVSIRIQSKLKGVLEGVYYGLWWYMWNFRNKLLFDKKIPEKALIFDNLVFSSFYWCKFRCKASFKWDDWLKNPYIVLV
ncbi:RNA-directed DNA polymerase, eukaryota [Tanacetum coccineum]